MKVLSKKIWKITLIFLLMIFINISKIYGITMTSNEQYEGIDVSDWQGYIEYNKVKETGIDIVYIKASQGNDFKDPYFEINYDNAKANGLKIGFYHFLTATNTMEAEEQARFFVSVIANKSVDCKLVMDYEIFSGVEVNKINEIANSFLETVKNLTNAEVIIYSDLYNAKNIFSKELAQKYGLWLAYYENINNLPNIQTNWNNYIGVQYTDRGIVSGVTGKVDRDIYAKEIFLDNISKIPSATPIENINTETINYTVKSGDTLSQIATRYNTTIQEIATINNISNPNLIYPGQILKIPTNSNIEGTESRATGSITYIVKSGDTLSMIAEAYGVTIEHIIELNNIRNPNLIYPNEKLRITESSNMTLNAINQNKFNYNTYTIQKGDTLYAIAKKYKVSVSYLIEINEINNPNLIYAGNIIKI